MAEELSVVFPRLAVAREGGGYGSPERVGGSTTAVVERRHGAAAPSGSSPTPPAPNPRAPPAAQEEEMKARRGKRKRGKVKTSRDMQEHDVGQRREAVLSECINGGSAHPACKFTLGVGLGTRAVPRGAEGSQPSLSTLGVGPGTRAVPRGAGGSQRSPPTAYMI